jgi:hypothetical protein
MALIRRFYSPPTKETTVINFKRSRIPARFGIVLFFVLACSFCAPNQAADPDPLPFADIDYDRFKGNEMIIITVDKYLSALQPFVQYKTSLGMRVEIDTAAAPLGVAAIRETLQRKYANGGVQFIILVGDIEDVPSPYFQDAPSDPSYALLEGDDLVGDALISRLSVKNTAELGNIVNKLLVYEKGEFPDREWIGKAIVVGTSEFDGVNHTSGIAGVMRSQPDFFDQVIQVLQTDRDPHRDVMNAIENDGGNMIVYNSHGSEEGFHSIEFTTRDIPELKTFGRSFPFIHGAACSTGSFQWAAGDCFAEAILKTGTIDQPAGAIGMLAFSRGTDSGPAMMAQRIAFKELYYDAKIVTIGELCYFSNLRVMSEFDRSSTEPFYKHWHLFGDCSARIWKHQNQ